jgi:hypothetical protein
LPQFREEERVLKNMGITSIPIEFEKMEILGILIRITLIILLTGFLLTSEMKEQMM